MEEENNNINSIGYYSSICLVLITFVTFGSAIMAVPVSGVNCIDCLKYPYLDTLSQFPRDYIWMFLAILLILTYLIFIVSIHSFASKKNKIFSRIGLSFAIISSVILLSCYFIQVSVIPASLINGETEGIALFTQYNPHGVFIALEELGYLMMSFSFLFVAPVFAGNNRIEKSIRWIFVIAFIATVLVFASISFKYGIVRMDRFEIAVIGIDWMTLVTNGVLAAMIFRRGIECESG